MGQNYSLPWFFNREEKHFEEDRISSMPEDDLVIFRLNYLKSVLNDRRNEYDRQTQKELKLAVYHKKNKSKAKFHLQKKAICQKMSEQLDGKILLVEKQIITINTLRDDAELARTLKTSNAVLDKMMKEVDTNQISEAIDVINQADENSQEMARIMGDLGLQDIDEELDHEYHQLGQSSIDTKQVIKEQQQQQEKEKQMDELLA